MKSVSHIPKCQHKSMNWGELKVNILQNCKSTGEYFSKNLQSSVSKISLNMHGWVAALIIPGYSCLLSSLPLAKDNSVSTHFLHSGTMWQEFIFIMCLYCCFHCVIAVHSETARHCWNTKNNKKQCLQAKDLVPTYSWNH